MSKINSNNKKKEVNKYNAENEIIIGVTTKQKEKVRVESKKTTRTNDKIRNNNMKDKNFKGVKNNQKTSNKKNIQNERKVQAKNIKANNKDIEKEKKIKEINRKKIIISSIFILFMALGGTIYYLTTPVFNISNIEVFGNKRNTVETYISLSKIDIGTTNLFAVTNSNISKSIKENPYVEEVKIKRKLPNTVQIYITERTVSYQMKQSSNYIYIDNQGYILEISEVKKDVPVIEGFDTSFKVGKRLIEEELIKLNVVAKIINYCTYNTIENKITNIDVTDDTNYIVRFKEDKKTVYLGDASNLSERLSLLKTILKNEEDKEIEIFMNGDLNEDDVYIRYLEE